MRLNDVEIDYEVTDHTPLEAAPRTPVLFVHGLHSSREHWRNQVPAFSVERPVVTWDLRGHGRSGMDAASFAIADHVGDLAALIDHLQLDAVHVVGGSAGGFIAQQIALLQPTAVRSITLVGTAARVAEDTLDPDALTKDIRERGVDAVYREFMRQYTFGPRASDELFEFVFRILADPSTEAVVRRLRGMLHYDGAQDARRIACPALVLAGEVDATFDPEMSHELRRLIPDSQLALLPSCGHLPQLEAPELFNPTLRGFLDEVDSRAASG